MINSLTSFASTSFSDTGHIQWAPPRVLLTNILFHNELELNPEVINIIKQTYNVCLSGRWGLSLCFHWATLKIAANNLLYKSKSCTSGLCNSGVLRWLHCSLAAMNYPHEHLFWERPQKTGLRLCFLRSMCLWVNDLLKPLISLLNGINMVPACWDHCEDEIANMFKALQQQTWQVLNKWELLLLYPALCCLEPWRTLQFLFWMKLPIGISLWHIWERSTKSIFGFSKTKCVT